MLSYIIRRLLFAIPTLIAISFIVFAILDLAPSDPTGNLPLTIPPEVREQIRESLGLGQPFHIRYLKWLEQFFINEPLNLIEKTFDIEIGDSENRLRVRSWATRSPVVDLIMERLPQTLWVVGLSYVVGILIAIPIGVGYDDHVPTAGLGILQCVYSYFLSPFWLPRPGKLSLITLLKNRSSTNSTMPISEDGLRRAEVFGSPTARPCWKSMIPFRVS